MYCVLYVIVVHYLCIIVMCMYDTNNYLMLKECVRMKDEWSRTCGDNFWRVENEVLSFLHVPHTNFQIRLSILLETSWKYFLLYWDTNVLRYSRKNRESKTDNRRCRCKEVELCLPNVVSLFKLLVMSTGRIMHERRDSEQKDAR